MGARGQIGGKLLSLATRLDLAYPVAWLLRRSIREWGNKNAKCRVLCVQRSIFEEDVRAMAARTNEVCFGMLPKGRLNDVFQYFIDRYPDPEGRKLTEYNYHHGCCAEALAGYRAFMARVVDLLYGLWPFDLMLSGNFGYLQQQEVALAVKNRGIPSVTLFKEGLVIPAYLNEMAGKVINGKRFLGSKIIFYSEQIRDAVLKSDAFEGCEFEVAVSGIPRMDQLVGAPLPEKRKIVLFSFYPDDKFRCFQSAPETLKKACAAADRFHRMFFRFAAENPDWDLLVKTKVGSRYLEYAQQLLDAELGGQPANIVITNSGAAVDMILDSRVVAAFTSTTGIEALVAGRTVICPDFAEYFGDEPWDYFQDDADLVVYAKSPEDLRRAVEAKQTGRDPGWRAKRDAFLRRMVHGADGKACDRATGEILKSIATRRSNAQQT